MPVPSTRTLPKASEAEAVKQNLPRTYGGGKVVMEWARAARARGPGAYGERFRVPSGVFLLAAAAKRANVVGQPRS